MSSTLQIVLKDNSDAYLFVNQGLEVYNSLPIADLHKIQSLSQPGAGCPLWLPLSLVQSTFLDDLSTARRRVLCSQLRQGHSLFTTKVTY